MIMKNLIFKDIEDQLQFILRCNDAFDKYLNQDSPKYNKFKFTLRIGSYYIFAANDGTEPDVTKMQHHSIKEIEFQDISALLIYVIKMCLSSKYDYVNIDIPEDMHLILGKVYTTQKYDINGEDNVIIQRLKTPTTMRDVVLHFYTVFRIIPMCK